MKDTTANDVNYFVFEDTILQVLYTDNRGMRMCGATSFSRDYALLFLFSDSDSKRTCT